MTFRIQGRTTSHATSGPPIAKTNLPVAAIAGPPKTGAERSIAERSPNRVDNFSIVSGWTVEQSTKIFCCKELSFSRAWSISPSRTSSLATYKYQLFLWHNLETVVTMVKTMSHFLTISRKLLAGVAPKLSNDLPALIVRLKYRRAFSSFFAMYRCKFSAIGRPIEPRPYYEM